MNNEEIKDTVKIYLNQYHNSLFNIALNEKQLEEVFDTITKSLINKLTNNEN